jgi:hypothetical protein
MIKNCFVYTFEFWTRDHCSVPGILWFIWFLKNVDFLITVTFLNLIWGFDELFWHYFRKFILQHIILISYYSVAYYILLWDIISGSSYYKLDDGKGQGVLGDPIQLLLLTNPAKQPLTTLPWNGQSCSRVYFQYFPDSNI